MPDINKQTEENTKSIAVITNDLGYIKKQLDLIDRKIDELFNGVPNRSEFEALKKEVTGLQNLKDWAMKLVLGAVIVALIGLVIST